MAGLEIPSHVAISFFQTYLDGTPKSGKYCARCPVCGDSETHRHKKRLYLLDKDNGYLVYCHNCAYSASLFKFINEFYPEHYDHFKSECLSYSNIFKKELPKTEEEKFKEAVRNLKNRKRKNKPKQSNAKTEIELYLEKKCYPLIKDLDCPVKSKINRQRKYFLKRGLSKELVDQFYYCNDMRYKDRVIIPFFDNEQKIYYFQARSTMDHQQPKYLNWKSEKDIEDGDEHEGKPEYNEYGVDIKKEVFVVEGLIDSIFLDNAVSTLGASMSNEKIKYYCDKYPNRIFCLDNDITGWDKTLKLFKMNHKCFIFPSEYRHIKDLNDLAIELQTRDLSELVRENTFTGVQGVAIMKSRGIMLPEKEFYRKESNIGDINGLLSKIKRYGRV